MSKSVTTPPEMIDWYKGDHISQYPEGTTMVFSNVTARASRDGDTEYVFFGLQYFVKKYLIEEWNDNFFRRPKHEAVGAFNRRAATSGMDIDATHLEALHDLGYLPISILALPEGSVIPIGVASMVIFNTEQNFFWLTNSLETILSATLWGPCTSATTARKFRKLLENAAVVSGGDLGFVDWQGHDFSFRGMMGLEAASMSGAGHLLSFTGTDTVPAIGFLEQWYNANANDELIGGSVPATEHSVMCMGGLDDELETFRRLITEVYPNGIVSIVSDTWDYWKVWMEYLPQLKDDIMARDGIVTIRPDSGDPVKILVGDPDAEPGSPEFKGSFELAWELFGGETNDEGYKLIDSHINVIYGDSITEERADQIINGLLAKGFVPKMILGIGSFTYQFKTRDSLGFVVKATYGEINGVPKPIFKDPKTGGWKKSAKGLIAVNLVDGVYVQTDEVTWADVNNCAFEPVFENGILFRDQTLTEIREIIRAAT
jgi:nicotinamide phosphoribosyltransferase